MDADDGSIETARGDLMLIHLATDRDRRDGIVNMPTGRPGYHFHSYRGRK